jgi:dihydroorotase
MALYYYYHYYHYLTNEIFDREARFLEQVMAPLVARHPNLKIVLEHATTADAVNFVNAAGPNVACSLTAHHLLASRNAMLVGGLKPHLYCLPILKAEPHRQALLKALASGSPQFFAGTDSAPHEIASKHTACACAGVFTGLHPLELYAEAFEEAGASGEQLGRFLCASGAAFYGLEPNEGPGAVLVRAPTAVPERVPFGDGADAVVPFRAGMEIGWSREE